MKTLNLKEYGNRQYEISHNDRMVYWFGSNGYRILLGAWIFFLIFEFFFILTPGSPRTFPIVTFKGMTPLCLCLALMWFLGLFKQLYSIVFTETKVIIVPLTYKKIYEYKIEDFESVTIGYCHTFRFSDGKSFMYSDNPYYMCESPNVDFFQKKLPFKWGLLGKIRFRPQYKKWRDRIS